MMPDMDGYEVTKRLRKNPQTSNIPILMFTAKTQLEDKVKGFETGADDYLTKPTHPSELTAHIKALLARTAKTRTSTPPTPTTSKPCMVVGVLSPRGGEGVTTVAVNLADALRVTTGADVIMAEMRPGMGTLGMDMGEANPSALTELLSGSAEEITVEKVKGSLFVHPTGVRMLFGSPHPRDGRFQNSTAQMEALVERLSSLAPYVVLDLGSGLSPAVQRLISLCDLIYVLVEPQANPATHSMLLLDEIPEMGISKQFIKVVVVNRMRSDTQITMSQIEDMLGQAPVAAITPAPELMYMAARAKTTVRATRPDSLTAQQFSKLAEATLELEKKR
jgi:pilus assembly protein CpaE